MKKKLLSAFAAILLLYNFSQASNVENLPHTLKQPNGEIVKVFISGDEFNRRVFDENGFTIIQDKQSGYWVYANLQNDELVPTEFIVGKVNPATKNLYPNIDVSTQKKKQNYETFRVYSEKSHNNSAKSVSGNNLRSGTLNNITIYIDFAGEQFAHSKSEMEVMFSDPSSGVSLYSYYRDASGGNFNIVSTFYPKTTGNVVYAYTAPQPRGYYQIYNAVTNPIGYNETDQSTRRCREHQLLYDAIMSLKTEIESDFTASQLDYDMDDYVDNISFVIQDGSGDMVWSNAMFWPHRWGLFLPYPYYSSYRCGFNDFPVYPTIHGKYVWDYFLITENHLFNIGNGHQSVLVHEMGHVLGAPDLYTGYCTQNCITPIGYWDVMASNTVPPQSAGAYISSEYWNFIDTLPVITSSGTYTVYHSWDRVANHNTGYKIMSPSVSDEYYVIDYRRKTGTPNAAYDINIPDEGLIITRINPSVADYGNIYGGETGFGEDYEAYIFRPGASDMITNGNWYNSAFSIQNGRTSFNSTTNPSCFLEDGTIDNIKISQISASGGDSMTFYVDMNNVANLENYDLGFTIYPNPATNYLNIDFNIENNNVDNIKIFDIAGKEVYSSTFHLLPTTLKINISQLPSGTYTIKIGDHVAKFVKNFQ
jgi:M6 family metalloprotease-like protein